MGEEHGESQQAGNHQVQQPKLCEVFGELSSGMSNFL